MENSDIQTGLFCMAAALLVVQIQKARAKQLRRRRIWVSDFLKQRQLRGSRALVSELQLPTSLGLFQNFTRMSAADFHWLLTAIEPKISKQDTNYRRAISAEERLALTLRFLATGDSYASLQYLFRISTSAISLIVREVCQAICEALEDYIKLPRHSSEWRRIANGFEDVWNFPHCLGAVDGRHCEISAPANSGTDFYNYEGFFSIVLLGVVDAEYCFIYVNVGSQGRISDGGVLKNTSFWKQVNANMLDIPDDEPLAGNTRRSPYTFIGDQAFALHEHMLKPYPGEHLRESLERVFNYRLSRARRVVENAFGIMSAVFRVLRKPMLLGVDNCVAVVQACTYLHNFLRKSKTSRPLYTPGGALDAEAENGRVLPGSWRQGNEPSAFVPMRSVPRKTSKRCAEIRNDFAQHFISDNGRITWQDNYC